MGQRIDGMEWVKQKSNQDSQTEPVKTFTPKHKKNEDRQHDDILWKIFQ